MRWTVIAVLVGFASPLQARDDRDTVLRVLRHTPNDGATTGAYVTITFDRPVAGALDRSVDASKLFRIEPAVPGSVVWRDPVTIRFLPEEPLAPGTRFRVTIDNAFTALDGSRLAAPFRFTFRVSGPVLLSHAPRRQYGEALGPNQKLLLLYSAPVDLAALGRATRLELYCRGRPRIKLTPVAQRPVLESDGYEFIYAGDPDRDTVGDRFRRVVELTPNSPVPGDCEGWLAVPRSLAPDAVRGVDRYPVRTRPSFRVERFECAQDPSCAAGFVFLQFSTPVKREDVQRFVRIEPRQPFTIQRGPTDGSSPLWMLRAALAPRTKYTLAIDPAIRDVYGRPLVEGGASRTIETADRMPRVAYGAGLLTIPARGPRMMALHHVNVDTALITLFHVPKEARARALGMDQWWGDAQPLKPVGDIVQVRWPLRGSFNRDTTTLLPLDDLAARAGGSGLLAIRVGIAVAKSPPDTLGTAARSATRWGGGPGTAAGEPPLAVVQTTDLAAHSKLFDAEGTVFVTGVSDGLPRRGARVTLFDERNVVIARGTTNDAGLATLVAVRRDSAAAAIRRIRRDEEQLGPAARYLEVSYLGDHSFTPVVDAWRTGYYPRPSPLDVYRLGARPQDDARVTGLVFTERGVYRPGETVFAKAIVRTGALGDLRRPARTDSVRWTIKHWDGGAVQTLRDTVVPLSEFGTTVDSLRLRPTAALGRYRIEVLLQTRSATLLAAEGEFRVAEYRAPEFLVDLAADSVPRFARDTMTAQITARYLFGAPMGNARVEWSTTVTALSPGQFDIPSTAGWVVGEWGSDRWEPGALPVAGTPGQTTLDSAGRVTLRVAVPDAVPTRPSRMEIQVAVTDVNRQTVTASTGLMIHPAAVYIAARHARAGWVWTVGTPQQMEVRTVRPDGRAVPMVPVEVTVVRRHWVHESARDELTPGGGWQMVTDTVARDRVVTRDGEVGYTFTPREGGEYRVRLTARDDQGRAAATTLWSYAVGGGRSWWAGDSPYRLPLVATSDRLAVGDTVAVVFDSPFDRAEAWLTVERESVLEQRRFSVRRGATTVRLPMMERHAPNVFVSVLLVRTLARDAAPPDSAPQVLRAGYTELHVDPAVKRLRVSVKVTPRERGPGETTAVHLEVRDHRRAGLRSEVALWAVDEGVLALTDYNAPEPVGGLYKPRGVGVRLRSTLTSLLFDPVVEQAARRRAAARRDAALRGAAARDQSMRLNAVSLARADTVTVAMPAVYPTTGAEVPGIAGIPVEFLRSQFRSTAFFFGDVVTDDTGRAVIRVKLPDNLTTYTVFAIAVSDGDRYGAGLTSFLVTRPLVARPALPRFVRASDSLVAGPVVNARDGGAHPVRVDAQVEGATLISPPRQAVTLDAGRGAEARFAFVVPGRDSAREKAVFRFGVAGAVGRDAVETRLDVRPDYHPRTHTAVGVVRDAASVELRLPAGIDPARSRLMLRVGTSPLVPMLAAYEQLRVYPYYCTEQISSGGRALVAIYRATGGTRRATAVLGANPVRRLQQLADELSRRQRDDGAIGFWRQSDWSSAWLSAYAGLFLLDARTVGVVVEQRVLDKLARYLAVAAADTLPRGGENPTERHERRLRLGERVAAIDFLRRAGRHDRATEDRLLARAADMVWEDRLRLAEALARRTDIAPQVRALLDEAWRGVTIAGARVDLPDTALTRRDFPSRIRPAARLLTATLTIRPDHSLIGALVETVLQQGRAERYWAWNTQDYASVVMALAGFGSGAAAESGRRVTVVAAGRTLIDRIARPHAADGYGAGDRGLSDSAVALSGLLRRDRAGAVTLPLRLVASDHGDAVFYALTVEEVPAHPPTSPDVQGIAVERWYERFDNGKPVTSVEEGALVRVRLRVTVPADRHFVVVDDALPAGLEPVDLSLRTSGTLGPFATPQSDAAAHHGDRDRDGPRWQAWLYGSWDNGWWSPWDHKEIRDDRVVYFARALWKGTYTASYVARATTRGTFVRPPAHAEEMYNPGVHGRSDGGRFWVVGR